MARLFRARQRSSVGRGFSPKIHSVSSPVPPTISFLFLLLLFLSLETGKGVYLPLSPPRSLSATGRVDPLGEPPNLGRGPSGLRRTIQHRRNLTGIELTESLVRRHTLPLPLCRPFPYTACPPFEQFSSI